MNQHMLAAAVSYLAEYAGFLEDYDPYLENVDKIVSPEAFIRAKIMNAIDEVTRAAMEQAEGEL